MLAFFALTPFLGQGGIVPPPGWTVKEDQGVIVLHRSDGAEVWMKGFDLKGSQTDLAIWLKAQSLQIKIDQADRVVCLDGRPIQLVLAEDPSSGKILIMTGRPTPEGTRVAMLSASDVVAAEENLSILSQSATLQQAKPAGVHAEANTSAQKPGAPPPSKTPPKDSHRQMVYDPDSKMLHILSTGDPKAKLSGSYAYVSDLFASPIGDTVSPLTPSTVVNFDGEKFALASGKAGAVERLGVNLTLHFAAGQVERFNLAVLESQDGVATRFAIGPCVYALVPVLH